MNRPPEDANGFTLIEVLVALSIVALSLAAIGNLTHGTFHAIAHVERSLAEVEVARQLITAPRARSDASPRSSGQVDGHDWRIAAEPFHAAFARSNGAWTPVKVELDVARRGGGWLRVETIRLVRPRSP